MPEGPLGFPRLTDVGPLTNKTDMEVVGNLVESEGKKAEIEAAVRRTEYELAKAGGSGLPKAEIHSISRILNRGSAATYYGNENRIAVSYEPAYLIMAGEEEFKPYLKALVAHEYSHFILDYNDDKMEDVVRELAEHDLFDYRDIEGVVEYYDFPQDQYVEYSTFNHFISHLTQYKGTDSSRPVEGFANIVAVRYAGITFQEYRDLHDEVHMRANDIASKATEEGFPGGVKMPGVWSITWKQF